MEESHSTIRRNSLISVVVPVFNESRVIKTLYERTASALSSLDGFDYEILFVDDGSSDDSYKQLLELAERDAGVGVIKFSRNFGHQVAITAGIDYARGDCVAIIDADLQDPPEVIAEMTEKWREGFDVVYGVRGKREGETVLKLATASAFYKILGAITKVPIPPSVGDFRLMSRRAVDEFKQLREKDRFVRGMVSWIGFPQTGVTYHRDKRFAGETKYPYRKMIKFALDGIASFSTVPLKLATWLGYAASILAFLYLISVFVQKLVGITVEGWATIMVAIMFIGGVQLICLGIIGEYIGRIFDEIKQRPLYVVEAVTGATDESRASRQGTNVGLRREDAATSTSDALGSAVGPDG